MGRQAYLTRLALGRSPFEEPELTESGDFILGSHAHELDNKVDGYVQQFDEKGHPEHRAAKVAAKEFRRAKNDVLETIGVVVKKEKQESTRRRTTEKDKVSALLRENSYGPWLKALDSGLTLLSLWWLMSLRSRFQTFRAFSSLPLLEIIKSELRVSGPLTFFSSGFLAWLITMPVTFCRQSLVEIAADSIIQKFTGGADDTVTRKRYATRMNVLCQMLDFILFAIAAPVLMFSDLQILHLIPHSTWPNMTSLIPFTRGSPIRAPHLRGPLSTMTVLQSGFDILRSPTFIFWLYDRARHEVEAVNYRIVCATVPRPDLPDNLSKIAAHKGDEDEDTIPGLWLHDGPTLLQQIQHEVEYVLDWIRSWQYYGREKLEWPPLEDAMRLQSVAIEREILFGPTTAHRPRPSESMAREIRRHAARLSWESQGQTPPDDLDAWIGFPRTPQTSSTNTPEPEELFTAVEADVDGDATNDLLPPRELIADSTLLEPRQPDSRPGGLFSEPVFAEAPNTDGLARGQTRNIQHDPTFPVENNDAFWEYFLHNYTANVTTSDGRLQMWENPDEDTTPPPVRRARMLTIEDSISRILSRSQSRNRERLDSRGWAEELPRHRVTSLSNYPADAFAYHMSMVLTTVMMLPLESLYLRALARGFLESPTARPGAMAAAAGIRADVRGLGAWFGGSERGLVGRVRYTGVMALVWGMQAVISAGIWGVGTRVAVWIGRSTFGWGRD